MDIVSSGHIVKWHNSRALSQYLSRSSGMRPRWDELYGKVEMSMAMHDAMQYASYTRSAFDSQSFLLEIVGDAANQVRFRKALGPMKLIGVSGPQRPKFREF
jgi:hypothetical protein